MLLNIVARGTLCERACTAAGSRTRLPAHAVASRRGASCSYRPGSCVTMQGPVLRTARRIAASATRSRPVALPSNEVLDLTEENVKAVLLDAREELLQLFDVNVGITGKAELAELDGPVVRLRLSGRFWHQRSLVVLRVGAYLQQRIPEVLEVEIEDEAQLDDSPAAF